MARDLEDKYPIDSKRLLTNSAATIDGYPVDINELEVLESADTKLLSTLSSHTPE